MRQITLELLRHGPPNNQLLSPLTQYLALCENHAAVTVQLPFEHNQFLHRLEALSYRRDEESRRFQLADTARVLGNLLSHIPGLIAEINRDPPCAVEPDAHRPLPPQRLTQLRLIISAAELALLPFELALAPNGFPGSGQSLLLQSQEPICLTREIRRVAERQPSWPRRPRVLFIAAAPYEVGEIPFEKHRHILERILEPWIYGESEMERRDRLGEHLVILEQASAEQIERECARGEFSHIHILAHGMQYTEGFDTRFGIALHHSRRPNELDVVNGDRLATILRPEQQAPGQGLARPLVVTLASCESSNQGTVMGVGGSIAHALHAAGIPIVIASQFPISFAGSELFADILYSGLLGGDDPRVTLNDLRRRLHSLLPGEHDWTSVTAYVSLPADFDTGLERFRIEQTMRAVEVAMDYADRATAKLMTRKPSRSTDPPAPLLSDSEKSSILHKAREVVESGRSRLEGLLRSTRAERARVYGLLASVEKRCAQVYFSFSRISSHEEPQEKRTQYEQRMRDLLDKARRHYWDAFLHDRDESWAVVQYLSLDLVLRRLRKHSPEIVLEREDEHNRPEALWNLAHVLSINELRSRHSRDDRRIPWAAANLIELYLLALAEPSWSALAPNALADLAVRRAQDLVDRVGREPESSFEIYSTRRQLLRYDDWYTEIATLDAMVPALERTLDVLPRTDPAAHR